MSIKKKLSLIVLFTLFEITVTIWGAFQLTKGATFHQLNLLHWKYDHGFKNTINGIDKAKQSISDATLNKLEDDIRMVREQPIGCLREVTFLDKIIMNLIGTVEIISICARYAASVSVVGVSQ